jgi:hypothetical protein
MDFRAAARKMAGELSSDLSVDPTMQDASLPSRRDEGQPDVSSDGMDPASPGGPSPYNGADPFGEPVATDEEWLDPQGPKPKRYEPMPHVQGPDEDVTTLHSARLASYYTKKERFR